ncbi:dipeptidase [Paenibacillus sp. sptzw28]|uniref:dipeptidase n=1 Tax=Paenibacillus sp. sptzw28 TaxID=715179 RepID=UPI001C6E152B|nr:dipeptidase [Paenibacillus sp. sptzw28]QYR19703.1 dipeptidase [Paenibacillus sp. sptzw28]
MTKLQSLDFHCDVLYKLLQDDRLSFAEDTEGKLDVTLPRLKDAAAVFQTFAIYIPDEMEKTMTPILRSIDLFHRKILSEPDMKWVRTSEDIRSLQSSGKIGAMLSLEGADGLQGDLAMLRILFHLGVRAAGLTWNRANWGADGVMEPRQGGLTAKGREFVQECNNLGILLDVSHLSERSFWDMLETATKPVIASHSNSRVLCDHPRNLTDEQIKALIAKDGLIGITFVPYFIRAEGAASVDDVLKHIERMCELGGEHQLMFGSDFDGIDSHVIGLSHPGELPGLKEELLKRYSQQQVKAFLSENAMRFLTKHLPE